jgi:hypothetical protein
MAHRAFLQCLHNALAVFAALHNNQAADERTLTA